MIERLNDLPCIFLLNNLVAFWLCPKPLPWSIVCSPSRDRRRGGTNGLPPSSSSSSWLPGPKELLPPPMLAPPPKGLPPQPKGLPPPPKGLPPPPKGLPPPPKGLLSFLSGHVFPTVQFNSCSGPQSVSFWPQLRFLQRNSKRGTHLCSARQWT